MGIIKMLNKIKHNVSNELMTNKSLPVMNRIKINKWIEIEFYDLYRVVDSNGDLIFDRNRKEYIELAEILSNYIHMELDMETSEIKVILEDFTLIENRLQYLDIISKVTNFDMSNFIFKTENDKFEDKFKLLDMKSVIVKKVTNYTDEMIHELFVDIVSMIQSDDLKQFLPS